mmetsp:Transcript_25840/g.29540  ORF Transcript_25840/g.29540 Transcript_25840/m.29540 type:complete len:226 (-) Transcript_25840:873-1550(-)
MEGYHSSLVAALSRNSEVLGFENALNGFRQFHFPQFLMSFQHISLADNTSDDTGSTVSNIDSLCFIERDGLSVLEDFNFDRSNETSRSVDHPFISRLMLLASFRILESFGSLDENGFIFSQQSHFLDSIWDRFSGLQEERAISLDHLQVSELVDALCINWVMDNAIFVSIQHSQVHFFDEILVDLNNMSLADIISNQPFFSSLSLFSISIFERFGGAEMESLLTG